MWVPLGTPPWAADPPPGEDRYEADPESISASIFQVGLSCTIASLIVVSLRIYTRAFVIRGLKADDYLMIAAMACLIAFCGISILLTSYGAGTHLWNVEWKYFAPGFLQLVFFAEVVGCLMVSFNKLSVLSLYLFITPNKKFRFSVYVVMGVVATFSLVYILVQTLQCSPIEAQWDLRLLAQAGTTCTPLPVLPMVVLGIINIVIDLAVVVLPIPVILPLQLPRKDKVSCLLLFAAGGGLVCVAAIGRTIALQPLLHPEETADVTWAVVPELNWAFVEGSVGIVTASFPSIKPLVKHLRSKMVRHDRISGNDRWSLQPKEASDGSRSRSHEAHQLRDLPKGKEDTLQRGPADGESGPISARPTEGKDKVFGASETPSSSPPLRKGPSAKEWSYGSLVRPDSRSEVRMADFGVV